MIQQGAVLSNIQPGRVLSGKNLTEIPIWNLRPDERREELGLLGGGLGEDLPTTRPGRRFGKLPIWNLGPDERREELALLGGGLGEDLPSTRPGRQEPDLDPSVG
jgi:hypothetical protein